MVATDVVVEVNDGQNRNLNFLPLGRQVRGRFDVMKLAGEIGPLRTKFPTPIPGQRLAVDAKGGVGYLLEPLRDAEHAPIREQIEKSAKVASAVQTFEGIDVPTWLFWLDQIVKQHLAEVMEGAIPKYDEKGVQHRFHSVEQPDPTDRLAVAIERQADAIERQGTLMLRVLERLTNK